MTTDVVVRILAVVGAAVGGGLGLGLLARLLMHASMVRKPPGWSLKVVRVMGGGICGWLVALWLFGGGGSGIGGTGSFGLDSGTGLGDGKKTIVTGKQNGGATQSPASETVRIDVLGRDALSESDSRAERWYRIGTDEETRLCTFAEIKEAIQKRQEEQPRLNRIEIVLYRDSPDERVPIVHQLRAWAGDRNEGKMKVDVWRLDSGAPRK